MPFFRGSVGTSRGKLEPTRKKWPYFWEGWHERVCYKLIMSPDMKHHKNQVEKAFMFLKTYQKGTYTGVIELPTQTMHFYKGIPSPYMDPMGMMSFFDKPPPFAPFRSLASVRSLAPAIAQDTNLFCATKLVS